MIKAIVQSAPKRPKSGAPSKIDLKEGEMEASFETGDTITIEFVEELEKSVKSATNGAMEISIKITYTEEEAVVKGKYSIEFK